MIAEIDCSMIVLAWGSMGSLRDRDQEVLELLGDRQLHCRKLTKAGQPQHVLYLPGDLVPMPFQSPACLSS